MLGWLQRKLQVWRSNRGFRQWVKQNPGKKFHDYYVTKVASDLDSGTPHATIGGKLRSGHTFDESGKEPFDFLLERGLRPEHVCVDYGCGSLRVGQHLMRYLDPGNYWGLDVTDRFYKEGLDLIPPELLAAKKPHLHVIDREALRQAREERPDFVLSVAVLIHVPESELDEYFSSLLGLFTEKTVGFVKFRCARTILQYQGRSWAYPKEMIESRVKQLGGRPEFIPAGETFKDRLGSMRLQAYWLQVSLARSTASRSTSPARP